MNNSVHLTAIKFLLSQQCWRSYIAMFSANLFFIKYFLNQNIYNMNAHLLLLRKSYIKGFLLSIILMILKTNVDAQTPCSAATYQAPADILANAPEASGYNLVYKLVIPQVDQHWATQADIPYIINNTAALASTPYTRVAYYMKLHSSFFGSQWVWVSMDAFTNNINQIGIPVGGTMWQQIVHHMNTIDYTGTNKTGIDGNIEFWSNCYTAANSSGVPNASNDNFDFGDSPTPDSNCYGSFQVHDFNAQQTLFAYNGWAYAGSCDDLGIGTWSGGNADWTLTSNACYYDSSEVYVFVNTVSTATCKNAVVYLDANGNASITPDMVSSAVAGSCGIANVALSKTNFTCADKGNNSVVVTVTDNNHNVTTCTATVTVKDTTVPVIIASGSTSNAGCNPSSAAIQAALGTATVSDNCGGATISSSDNAVTINGCTYSQTRTWTATDASGNVASAVSRTITWTVDTTPPVITATGSATILSCSPSSAAIEAALGTATATDNCGLASLTSSTSAVTTNGNNSSQTRTWTAKDACNNTSTISRTVTWTSNCNHFFASTVTCSQFLNNAAALSNICYSNLLNIVSSASPSAFYYYTTVTAPSASFCVDVTQTKSVSSFKFYSINKITASTSSCNVVATGSEVSSGQGRVTITGATVGATYIIAVNYNAACLSGSTFPLLSAPPTCQNNFAALISNTGSAFGSGTASAGSQGSIKAIPNCSGGLLNLTVVLRPSVQDLLNVSAQPNPSNGYFNLNISGKANTGVSIRVLDMYGRVMETNKVMGGSTLKVGQSLPQGTYFIEAIQGNQRKIEKVIKLR